MLSNKIEFAEVQYFFNTIINNTRNTLAVVALYSCLDEDLFNKSNWTVETVNEQRGNGLRVIDAKAVVSVIHMIIMFPMTPQMNTSSFGRKWAWIWHCYDFEELMGNP